MGIGWSSAESTSTQVANSNITQQFSGTCKITCQNRMKNISAQIFNSSVQGGINVTQSCVVNGQCIIGNNSTAVSDVLFKAANSATASLAFGTLGGTSSKNSTYQEINQNVQEYSTENCEVSSVNSMSNVDIYAASSQIGGGINIGQSGNTNGNCALSNVMNATTQATGLSDNCAASGKASKKKACSGKGGGLGSILLFGIIGVILFVVIMMVVRYLKGNAPLDCEKPDGTFLPVGPCKKPDGTLLPKGQKYVRTPKPVVPRPGQQGSLQGSVEQVPIPPAPIYSPPVVYEQPASVEQNPFQQPVEQVYDTQGIEMNSNY